MTHSILPMLAMLAAVVTLAAGLAWVLRHAGLTVGSAVVGGALAGFALGPTILGRIMPEQYERWFIGGAEQREARDALVSLHGADLAVAEHQGFSRDDVAPIQTRHARERTLIDMQLDAARWTHQAPMRMASLVVAGLVLVGGSLLSVPASGHTRTWVTIVSVGLWSAALPGGIAIACGMNWWNLPIAHTLMLVAAVAIGPWAIRGGDREAADGAEVGGARMIQSAGRVASCAAVLCAGMAVWWALGSRELLLAVPLLALPLGWLLVPRGDSASTAARAVERIVLPALAALIAMKVDVIDHAALWPIVVIALICGDGRWFGAVLGALLPGGRRVLRTMRMALGSMAAGPTQLAVAAIGLYTVTLSEGMALALLIGAATVEVSAPLRRRLADQMETLEAELDEDAANED